MVTGTRIEDGSTCEVYDVKEDRWSQLPKLNSGRYYHSSCSFNDSKVFVFCGLESLSKKYLDSIECLDMNKRAEGWQVFQIKQENAAWPLLSARQGLGSCQYDQKHIMVLGGYSMGVHNDESFLINVEEQTI